MKIDGDNYNVGNKAMASVFLLYYHMISNGGFAHANTVYLSSIDVNLHEMTCAYCEPDESEIDSTLVREGAVIAVLSDLLDTVDDCTEDYWTESYAIGLIERLRARKFGDIPEVDKILDMFEIGQAYDSDGHFITLLLGVYKKYVLKRMQSISSRTCFG